MAASQSSCDTPEEHLVFWTITGTWGLWLLGALYHVVPMLGWGFLLLALGRRAGLLDDGGRPAPRIPIGVHIWTGGMALMAFALVMAHLDYDLGLLTMVKSLFGFAKGWMLLAVFIFAGSDLRIKPQVIYRATNILAVQTLAITPLFIALALAGAPEVLYRSPLYYLGGTSSMFFEVGSHSIDPETHGFRLHYFSPWAPAAAFSAHIALVCGLYDTDWRWRWTGVATAVVVCYLAQSRLSVVAIPLLLILLPALSNLLRVWPAVAGGVTAMLGFLFLPLVADGLDAATDAFNGARADSSRVRAALGRIAYQRWETEAPLFGHGTVAPGSHLVEYMPIGSHHTWYGLLFVKGAVGFLALAMPLAWTFCEVLAKAQRDPVARAALGVILVLTFNSFGENLEILAYLAWPGLLLIGVALQRPFAWPSFARAAWRRAMLPQAELV